MPEGEPTGRILYVLVLEGEGVDTGCTSISNSTIELHP